MRQMIIAAAMLVLAGCAHVTNERFCANAGGNGDCAYDAAGGYRFDPLKAPDARDPKAHRDTLVFLTLSGGGVRASALAYGTIEALNTIPSPTGAAGRTLMDEVDVVSSVSGGSVAAGWLAQNGPKAFPPAEDAAEDPHANAMEQFMYKGAMAEIAARGLNPVALLRYAVTDYQRSDVFAGVLADRLYGDATYSDVARRYTTDPRQPFVILNATDVGHETRFPFTQNRFDLLCSDLRSYRLAAAVGASADFPMAISATGLTNYSAHATGCGLSGRAAEAWRKEGPPRWISTYARYSDTILPSLYEHSDDGGIADGTLAHQTGHYDSPASNGLLALRTAREAHDYIDPIPNDSFIHLLDGGLADNLGIESALQLEDSSGHAPGLFQRLLPPRSCYPAYGKVSHVLFVVMNARSRSPVGIDAGVYPPDLFTTILRVIDTSLDNSILDMQNYLTSELQAIAAPPTRARSNDSAADEVRWVHCADGWMPIHAADESCVSLDPKSAVPVCFIPRIVTVDFELIPDKACRDHFWQLGTTWTLSKDEIRRLILLPQVLLRRSRELRDFYAKYAAFHGRDRVDAAFKAWSDTGGAADPFSEVCKDWNQEP